VRRIILISILVSETQEYGDRHYGGPFQMFWCGQLVTVERVDEASLANFSTEGLQEYLRAHDRTMYLMYKDIGEDVRYIMTNVRKDSRLPFLANFPEHFPVLAVALRMLPYSEKIRTSRLGAACNIHDRMADIYGDRSYWDKLIAGGLECLG
jgi:hypothetical protein